MIGETNLAKLLATMEPVLHPAVYGFATVETSYKLPSGLSPLMIFEESEGKTLIAELDVLTRSGLAPVFPSRMITLNIHSSLEAIGFLAAILPRLAAAGIGVNPVSGFFHDHLFVPADRAEDAMVILRSLSGEHPL